MVFCFVLFCFVVVVVCLLFFGVCLFISLVWFVVWFCVSLVCEFLLVVVVFVGFDFWHYGPASARSLIHISDFF